MKAARLYLPCLAMLAVTAFAGGTTESQTAAAKPAASNRTNAPSSEIAIAQSSFQQFPANNREGRDPFYPRSLRPYQEVTPKAKPATTPLTEFALKGLTPHGNPPTAMINNRVLAVGEEGEIKLPGGGKTLVRLLEIKEESAVIEVAGQRVELRFKRGV
jgi:hypothetical protein